MPAHTTPSSAVGAGRAIDQLTRARIVLETALAQWQAGERRLHDVPAERRRPLDRVVERLVAELRRRLGGSFSARELAELYYSSNPWLLTLAYQTSPSEPLAWEQWVADAAFNRYLRESRDWPLRRGATSD